MKTKPCERERDVVDALAAGVWPEELRDHLAGCASCAEAALVAQALCDAAAVPTKTPLPDAGVIWRAAQRRQRQAEVNRAMRPIRLMVGAAAGGSLLAAVAGLAMFWPAFTAQAAGIGRWFTRQPTLDVGQVLVAALGLAGLAAFTVAFALFESWTNE